MNDTVLYREKLPRYVFKGTQFTRGRIKVVQWWFRAGAISIIAGSIYLATSPKTEHDLLPVWGGIITALVACAILLHDSECKQQAQLDGSLATVVYDDRITIPPRLRRRLIGKPDHILKEDVDHVEVVRGWGNQYIASKDSVLWEDAPIAMRVVTTSRKVHSLGYKPPSTVKEMVDVLGGRWGIRIDDPGSGMGRGTRVVGGRVVGEYPYDEIMGMDLFEWQD